MNILEKFKKLSWTEGWGNFEYYNVGFQDGQESVSKDLTSLAEERRVLFEEAVDDLATLRAEVKEQIELAIKILNLALNAKEKFETNAYLADAICLLGGESK